MHRPSRTISRRTLLRGAGLSGIAIALPHLEAMSVARADAPRASRFVLFHWPDGVEMNDWRWRDGAASVQRSELGDLRSRLAVVTGLSSLAGQTAPGGFGTPHALPAFTAVTGTPITPGGGAVGASIDVVASNHLASTSPSTFNRIFAAPFQRAGGGGPGIAYLEDGARQAPMTQPSVLFRQLFAAEIDEEAAAYLALRRRSILDYVRDDARRLGARLGAADRIRLDRHLEAIRGLERSIVRPMCDAPGLPPEAEPVNAPESAIMPRAEALVDLQMLALSCGLTNALYFSMGHAQCTHYPYELEAELGEACNASEAHQITHGHGLSASYGGFGWYQALVRWRLRPFLRMMRFLVENDGADGAPLIDSTAVIAFSELSWGGNHNPYDLPVMVGGAGIAGGGMIHYPCTVPRSEVIPGPPSDITWYYRDQADTCADAGAMTSISNLWLTLLRALGSTAESYGVDSTGTLEGLWV
jgi:hypothetical protein